MMTPKGGAGKTTGTLILGIVLAEQGASVCLIDADPNQPLMKWAKDANIPPSMSIIGDVTEENIIETIGEQSAKNSFVIVDLEGSANLSTGYAITSSDLILIPPQPSSSMPTRPPRPSNSSSAKAGAAARKCPPASSGRAFPRPM